MSEWRYQTLDEHIRQGNIELGRGDVISKIDIEKHPGPYPIYSSSAQGDGKFGEYGKFMFDEELISWSVDGGGNFFYRPKHQFSVTNVSGYLRIKTKELGYRFLYYSLALQHRDISFDYTTKAHPSVIKKLYSVPSIPKTEQDRIAETLSTLDAAIERTEALIAKHQQIKAGLMHDLFTRGVTPDGRLRPTREQAPDLYKESPLGWIPKEWEIVFIADAFEIQLGKMLNKLAKSGKWTAPYLGNRSVQWDFVDCAAIEEMDFTPAERQKFSLEHGDLLVCEGGDVGRTAMWRGEIEGCFYQKAIHRLRPKSVNVVPAFMLRFMRFSKEHGYFREFTSQSSIAHLTQEKLGTMPMLMPKPAEQKRIAERFDIHDGLIQIEQAKLIKFRKQKHGLMHDLLTGKVRIKAEQAAVELADG